MLEARLPSKAASWKRAVLRTTPIAFWINDGGTTLPNLSLIGSADLAWNSSPGGAENITSAGVVQGPLAYLGEQWGSAGTYYASPSVSPRYATCSATAMLTALDTFLTTAYTFATWVRYTFAATGYDNPFMSQWSTADNPNSRFYFGADSAVSGKITATVRTTVTTSVGHSGGYNDGLWHWVLVTRRLGDDTVRLYVDAVEVGSTSPQTLPLHTSAKNIRICQFADAPAGRQYIGDIAHPVIWADGLSDELITTLYQQARGTFA